MTKDTPTAVHFGAGNIGRGFIGPMLVEAGYNVIFADVDRETIAKLNDIGYYDVFILDDKELGKPLDEKSVSHIAGVLSSDPAIVDHIAQADIITTAVGPSVLEKIAGSIADGLKKRSEIEYPLNIIACENMVGATTKLQGHILEHLPSKDSDPSLHSYISSHIGFANCSVDRIVPPLDVNDLDSPVHSEASSEAPIPELSIAVENYHEWVVDKSALRLPLPRPIPDMKLTSHLTAYVERKLYTLNTGHAISAYLGFLYNKPTIDIAVSDPQILHDVRGAMSESGAALCKKHGFRHSDHREYIEHILVRFRNPNLRDQVIRVGRGPLRKLGKNDRLLGPIIMCRELGLKRDHLLRGVAAALLYDNHRDDESVELQTKIKDAGVDAYVKELLEDDEEDKDVVLKAYEEFRGLRQMAN